MLEPGTRIGPYEVLSALGAGGMGEVYRARDTVLGRDVALKILPEAVARDPASLARLRREARILASLNHPGIATLHGLEERDGMPVIVMEVVEGETLSDRLHCGPLPIKEVLRIGQQVAEAVAAAHEKGVLHRDLKPANVRLTKEGRAKVLDFGLATALGAADASPLDSRQATQISPPSRPGMVVGTAPYMSPEQARGQELDARTDVWAFGCVLFEMLTAKRAFPGATFSEVSAAILERDPDFAALPESTPFVIQRLLRRCLRREGEERLRDIADAGLELREVLAEISSGSPVATMGSSGGAAALPAPRRPWWPWVAAGALLVAGAVGAGVLVYRGRRTPASEARQPRFEATLPRGVGLVGIGAPQNPLALSPNGQQIAFVGCGAGVCQIYLRDRREIDARPIPGTEDARSPFFSPDGRWIGFGAEGKVKKVSLDRGAVVTLADAPQFRGGSWGEDGTILFNRGVGGLVRVASEGGEAREVTKLDLARRDSDHRWPQHLPGGRAALLDITSETFQHDVAVVDLETGRARVLEKKAGSPRWSPTGHVLFGRDGLLYAAPFDVERLTLTGTPVPVLEGVAMFSSPGETNTAAGNVYYCLASDGTLVFSPREARLPQRTLVWVDRQGGRIPIATRQMSYLTATLSPDGTRLAANVDTGPGTPGNRLLLDIRREAWTKVPLEGEDTLVGATVMSWMPDGRRLLLTATSESERRLVLVQADNPGPAEELHVGEAQLAVPAPDGRGILFCAQPAPAQWDIWRLPLEGPRQLEPFLVTPVLEVSPSFSPDGRLVAYRSHESGRSEIYVRPYPGPGPRHLVSTHGGNMPLWSRDGREIFFVSGGASMSAAVRTAPTFASEAPRKLFDLPEEILWGFGFYDVSPDGQRFVMIEKDPFELRPLGLVIVPNWTAELEARMAAAGGPRRSNP